MTVTIDYETDEKLDLDWSFVIRDIAEAVLEAEECPYEAEVNVLLTDNAGMQEINLETRGIDAPTDVLSFPMIEFESVSDFSHVEEAAEDCFNLDTGELMLGDIVISVEKVKEQAHRYGHSERRELAFLTAHSMLHLCGYDHIEEEARLEMEKKQRRLLDEKGYSR